MRRLRPPLDRGRHALPGGRRPRSPPAGPGRVDDTAPNPESEDAYLHRPGRLVYGRYAPHRPPGSVSSAWGDGGVRHLLHGEDGGLYHVYPRTVRLVEPDFSTVGGMERERIIEHASPRLFEVLSDPAGDVTLASPFLTRDVATRIARLARDSAVDWYLLTRLDPLAVANGFQTVDGLRALLDAGVEIRDCSRLHAKAYVVAETFAMLGSANLTGAGLGENERSNSELSFVLPSDQIGRVQSILDDWWDEGRVVDDESLDSLERRAADVPRYRRVTPGRHLGSVVDQLIAEADDADVSLWVKAQHGDPDPSVWAEDGWFSSSKKGRPSFMPGDLVVLYSTVEHGVFGVVEVLDEPVDDPGFVAQHEGDDNGERWPWVNRVIPRLMPDPLAVVPGAELGINTRGLQVGHIRLDPSDFATAVHALASEYLSDEIPPA